MSKLKHLFLNIKIQEGEFEHNHKVLISTKCKNLEFAAQYYVAHYWGYGTREMGDKYWWWDGVHAGILDNWIEVSEEDYVILNKYV